MSVTSGISIHAVDITRGEVAKGLAIEILNAQGAVLSSGEITSSGVPDCAAAMLAPLENGQYTARFHVADYFRQKGIDFAEPPFLEVVRYDFLSRDPGFHIHLPFKFSPWGYSLFRGN